MKQVVKQVVEKVAELNTKEIEVLVARLDMRQAVELDMGLSLLAECVNLDETVLRKQRAKSVNDVKRTNGQVSFENAVRSQRRIEPDDTWPGSY